MHRADGFTAVGRADHFPDQDRTGRPFAAKAESLQAPHDEELLEISREAREESEECEPGDRDHQKPRPADAVGKHAGEPAAEGGNDQRAGRQQTSLRIGDVPQGDQGRNDEAVDLHVESIERPASEAGPKGASLSHAELAVPVDHPRPPLSLK